MYLLSSELSWTVLLACYAELSCLDLYNLFSSFCLLSILNFCWTELCLDLYIFSVLLFYSELSENLPMLYLFFFSPSTVLNFICLYCTCSEGAMMGSDDLRCLACITHFLHLLYLSFDSLDLTLHFDIFSKIFFDSFWVLSWFSLSGLWAFWQ